jgi:hypothetical protein
MIAFCSEPVPFFNDLLFVFFRPLKLFGDRLSGSGVAESLPEDFRTVSGGWVLTTRKLPMRILYCHFLFRKNNT